MRHQVRVQWQVVGRRMVVIGELAEHLVVQELTQVNVDLKRGGGRFVLVTARRRRL